MIQLQLSHGEAEIVRAALHDREMRCAMRGQDGRTNVDLRRAWNAEARACRLLAERIGIARASHA